MKILTMIVLLVALVSFQSKVQKDTTATVDLLGEMNKTAPGKTKCYSDKILFTQRISGGKGVDAQF